ncbi:hypothetical protein HG536_0D02830 [Torulaspora globosa]|uniref:CAP-Gly domain-containing protein n=1 Tax=Torulaspora globosa TaxID=48254 RepID=A0A7G3ZGX5_9SACH|nr:uncharacterized protein HG536_0D02830 [Torulaspora globosa]QLL32761.1 hypothetical protein HG536_0D02830 [Torulaspora globosa]
MSSSTMKVLVESELCSIAKDFPAEIRLDTLCDRIYPLTGIEPSHMKLIAKDQQGNVLSTVDPSAQDNEYQVLNDTRISRIFVDDTSANPISDRLQPGDEDVGFKLSEEDYAQRENTLLAWKVRNQMGRFDPAYKEQLDRSRRLQQERLETLEIDQRCAVRSEGRPERRGWLRFVGVVPEISPTDIWCGVQFDEPVGKNDGSIKGTVYFGPVSAKYGGFVKPTSVETGPHYSPLELDGASSEDEV